MEANYRPGFKYADFASSFTAKFFDAKKWAKIIAKSNAKYLSLSYFVYSLLLLLLFRLFIVTFRVLRITGAIYVLPYFADILYSQVSTMMAIPIGHQKNRGIGTLWMSDLIRILLVGKLLMVPQHSVPMSHFNSTSSLVYHPSENSKDLLWDVIGHV